MIVVNFLTEGTWADILAKPLQGKAFRMMRAKLMNCDDDYFESKAKRKERTKGKPVIGKISRPGSTQPLQECVGRSKIASKLGMMDRRSLGESRIVRRRTERPKQRRGE
jgi:hypothetical protein